MKLFKDIINTAYIRTRFLEKLSVTKFCFIRLLFTAKRQERKNLSFKSIT